MFDEALLDAEDAGVDASMDGGCGKTPPPRPDIADDEVGDDVEVLYAIRGVDLDLGSAWRVTGYDLDGRCSEGPMPDVECLPPSRSASPEIDGEGGIDNVFGHLVVPLLLIGVPDLQADAMLNQEVGLGAVIVRLRGWNGEANDPRVYAILTQSVYGTPGEADGGPPTDPLPDGGIMYEADARPNVPAPEWNRDDYWFGRSDTFLDGDPDRPRNLDDNAYVADRTLVMRLPDRSPIVFSGPTRGTSFKLTDASLTVRFTEDFEGVELALLTGRWAIIDVLDATEDTGICRDTDNYSDFAQILDQTADIRSSPNTGGPRVLCDAISVVLTFRQGNRANWGGVTDPFPTAMPCAMDGGT